MATVDLQVTSVASSSGFTGATVANLDTSDDSRATDGVADDFIVVEIDDVPGDFGSQNSITISVEAQHVGSIIRTKQITFDLLDSGDNVLQTTGTGDITGTEQVFTSDVLNRSDSSSVINGYKIRATVTEGGGMPDDATIEIDHLFATLDYEIAAESDDLLADDVESSSEVSSPSIGQEHSLGADSVESTSEVSSPSVGQEHGLTSTSVQSTSEVSSPSVGQEHALTATSVESTSEVSAPALSESSADALTATSIQSVSEVTSPSLGQIHVLTNTSLEVSSEVSSPSVGQEHSLTAESLESNSELTSPSLSESSATALFADDLEVSSEVSSPSLSQVHVLTAVSVEAAAQISMRGRRYKHVQAVSKGVVSSQVESVI